MLSDFYLSDIAETPMWASGQSLLLLNAYIVVDWLLCPDRCVAMIIGGGGMESRGDAVLVTLNVEDSQKSWQEVRLYVRNTLRGTALQNIAPISS
jgi:hypothetical protein